MVNKQFEFIGGSLCLDFANTVGNARNQPIATEYLTSYHNLLDWTYQAGLVTDEEVNKLDMKSRTDPADASKVLHRAQKLREAIYQIFSAISAGATPLDTDLSLLNEEVSRSLHNARIVVTPTGYAWGWVEVEELDAMIGPVARAAAEVLTSPSLRRVRECASQTCSWIFLDETKNHSRRWCNMKTCGNVDKVNRFRARQIGNN